MSLKSLKTLSQSKQKAMAVVYRTHQLAGTSRCMAHVSFQGQHRQTNSWKHSTYRLYNCPSKYYCDMHPINSSRIFTNTMKICAPARRFHWRSGEDNQYTHNNDRTTRVIGLGGVAFGGIILLGSTLLAKEKEDVKEDIHDEEIPQQPPDTKCSLQKTIELSRDLVQRIKDETGSPGLVIAVSVDGKPVWAEGLGYSDVENRIPCKPETVLRIASISKPITMAAVARLWENGDLDLDKPIQHYVPEFPEKTWKGDKVTITTRQLLSHLGGIRHYDKDYIKKQEQVDNTQKSKPNNQSKSSSAKTDQYEDNNKKKNEMELKEYYIMKKYNSVLESLELFKDDPLINKPGTNFCYTTHGWTLISAVVEKASKMKFEQYLQTLLYDLGMTSTYMEENDRLIYNRGRHYVKNKRGRLANAPYTDLSYKWAGGGLISSVLDLNKFGNAMLYSHQVKCNHGNSQSETLPGFLKPETIQKLWTKVDGTKLAHAGVGNVNYGLGWEILDFKQKYGCCRDRQCFASHTGAAVGGSSVLLILPPDSKEYLSEEYSGGDKPPKGVVVSIICNMTWVGLSKTALDIAKAFDSVDRKEMFDS